MAVEKVKSSSSLVEVVYIPHIDKGVVINA